MRTTTQFGYGTTSGYSIDQNGVTTPVVPALVQNYYHGVSRSDVTRTIRDSITKWREPTGYSVSDTEWNRDHSVRHYTSRHRDGARTESHLEGPSDWLNMELPPVPSLGSSFDNLTTKALLKVRDQKINLSLTIGEAHKSVDMIQDRAMMLYRAYKAAKRGRFTQAAKALGVSPKGRGRNQAKTWLELQYGWMPLLMDIHGAYSELTGKTKNNGLVFKVTARDRTTKVNSSSNNYSDGYFDFETTRTTLFEGQIILWYRVQNQWIRQASAVGLTNPMEILWEVTPWSFVVDWILPVGDYLGALTATQGMTFLGGTSTLRTTTTAETWATPKPPRTVGLWTSSFSGHGRKFNRTKTVVRSVIKTDPTPKVPTFTNPFSVGHALNAIALLRGLK